MAATLMRVWTDFTRASAYRILFLCIHVSSLFLSLLLYEEIDSQCEAQRTAVRCWWVNLEQRWNNELIGAASYSRRLNESRGCKLSSP
jgi:hypothetical protein